ncbi:MAG: hypothetical protein EBR09_06895 [Proteobacteria bacterium]|nr:hypothetical protein [Pseudomonadota bacterium]
MNKLGFLISAAACLVLSSKTYAGSVSGSQAQSQSGTSGGINCDQRVKAITCTAAEREHILDNCYVVLHKNRVPSPTWNSAEFISVVGSRPAYDPAASTITEFGLAAPIDKNTQLNCTSDDPKSCLPKHPFDRHYMTVRDALKIRTEDPRINPPFTDDFERVVKYPLQWASIEIFLQANPYTACAKSSEKVLLRYVGDLGLKWDCSGPTGPQRCKSWVEYPSKPAALTKGVMVGVQFAEKVCRTIRANTRDFSLAGVCFTGGDANGNGAKELLRFDRFEKGL